MENGVRDNFPDANGRMARQDREPLEPIPMADKAHPGGHDPRFPVAGRCR